MERKGDGKIHPFSLEPSVKTVDRPPMRSSRTERNLPTFNQSTKNFIQGIKIKRFDSFSGKLKSETTPIPILKSQQTENAFKDFGQTLKTGIVQNGFSFFSHPGTLPFKFLVEIITSYITIGAVIMYVVSIINYIALPIVVYDEDGGVTISSDLLRISHQLFESIKIILSQFLSIYVPVRLGYGKMSRLWIVVNMSIALSLHVTVLLNKTMDYKVHPWVLSINPIEQIANTLSLFLNIWQLTPSKKTAKRIFLKWRFTFGFVFFLVNNTYLVFLFFNVWFSTEVDSGFFYYLSTLESAKRNSTLIIIIVTFSAIENFVRYLAKWVCSTLIPATGAKPGVTLFFYIMLQINLLSSLCLRFVLASLPDLESVLAIVAVNILYEIIVRQMAKPLDFLIYRLKFRSLDKAMERVTNSDYDHYLAVSVISKSIAEYIALFVGTITVYALVASPSNTARLQYKLGQTPGVRVTTDYLIASIVMFLGEIIVDLVCFRADETVWMIPVRETWESFKRDSISISFYSCVTTVFVGSIWLLSFRAGEIGGCNGFSGTEFCQYCLDANFSNAFTTDQNFCSVKICPMDLRTEELNFTCSNF